MTFVSFLRAFFGFLDKLAAYLSNRQLMDAGGARAKVEAQQEVERNVEAAERAVSVPDADRDERLRSRFDRAGK